MVYDPHLGFIRQPRRPASAGEGLRAVAVQLLRKLALTEPVPATGAYSKSHNHRRPHSSGCKANMMMSRFKFNYTHFKH